MTDAFGTMATAGDETVRRVIRPLDESRGWMKLLAVTMYIVGGLYAISIVGLVVAWLPIWMGYLLWKSATAAEAANVTGNENDAIESLGRLKTLFTIQGVLVVISIGFTLLWMTIMIVAIIVASSN
jgi:hypothetical protein